MFKKAKLATMAAALVLSASANAYVLDSFTTTQYVEDNKNDGIGAGSTVNGAEIIGGWRDLFVTKDNGSTLGGAAASIEVFGGSLGYSAAANAGGTGMIRYDGSSYGTGVNATGLGSLNLFTLGSQFVLSVLSSDGGFPFGIRIWSGNGNSTTLNLFAVQTNVPRDFVIPFSYFASLPAAEVLAGATSVNTGSGGDLSNVGAIEVFWTSLYPGASGTVDFKIDTASVVPEPASLALLGVGLLGLGAARRRRAA